MPIRRSRMLRKDKFGGSRAGLPRPFQVFRQNPTWNEAIIYICRVKKKHRHNQKNETDACSHSYCHPIK